MSIIVTVCGYTCALISIHFFEVAIPLAHADARDFGNGFGILSQHGAIEESLDVLRIEPQSLFLMSVAAVARMKNHVVISTPFDYFTGMRSAKCYTAWQSAKASLTGTEPGYESDFDMENIAIITTSIQKLTLFDLASKRDH